MADVTLSKAALDADTDQALAFYREARKTLERSPEGRFYRTLGEGLAEQMAVQFPGVPCGFVLMAAARSLKEMKEALAAQQGFNAEADTLLSVMAVAAEQLDREAR